MAAVYMTATGWRPHFLFIYLIHFGQCVATELQSGGRVTGFTYKRPSLNV